ncbi:predicted protein [Histoplasma capsulatum var. duboisii H88]|uniref:Predicted protein n=2 Tax=Ajellomyces capsulatus TaxID=5037 RepID=F0UP65_AJEC8|nr:predicted protein [Histoplasma capsulatum H143]EGC47717.1 predicted protein [Histoplasma capsulatum var. duboisii H88]
MHDKAKCLQQFAMMFGSRWAIMDDIIQIDHNHSEKFSEAIKHKVRSEDHLKGSEPSPTKENTKIDHTNRYHFRQYFFNWTTISTSHVFKQPAGGFARPPYRDRVPSQRAGPMD